MNKALKVIRIGNSSGVILPKDVLAKLRVEQGEELYITETADGFRLSAMDPGFDEKMKLAEKLMREDRDILHVLAQ